MLPIARPVADSKTKERMASLRRKATARLMKDLRDLRADPLGYANACPVSDDNLFFWHANILAMSGPLTGLYLHLFMDFPVDYPRSPPNVRLGTTILGHPNVFGGYICLDMIKNHHQEPYRGWSTSYTVSNVLMQLYSFLMEADNIPQDYGGSARSSSDRLAENVKILSGFTCRCGHTAQNPFPRVHGVAFEQSSTLQRSLGIKTVLNRRDCMGAEVVNDCVVVGSLEENKHAPYKLYASKQKTVSKRNPWGGVRTLFGIAPNEKEAFTFRVDIVTGTSFKVGVSTKVGSLDCGSDSQGWSVSVLKGNNTQAYPTMCHNGQYTQTRSICSNAISAIVCVVAPSSSRSQPRTVTFHSVDKHTNKHDVLGNLTFQPEEEGAEEEEHGCFLYPTISVKRNTTARLSFPAKIAEKKEEETKTRTIFYRISDDSIRLVCSFLTEIDLLRFQKSAPLIHKVIAQSSLVHRTQLNCFVTKTTFEQNLVGIGIDALFHRDGQLKTVESDFDVLSYNAFDSLTIRKSVWNKDFQFFLPLYINRAHFAAAQEPMTRCMGDISKAAGLRKALTLRDSIDVVARLMNSSIVSFMLHTKDAETDTSTFDGYYYDPYGYGVPPANVLPAHHSEKALRGFTMLHQLMLGIGEKLPQTLRAIHRRVQTFIRCPDARLKNRVPDLGILLALTCATEHQWEDFGPSVFQEAMIRNARWVIKEDDRVAYLSLRDDELVRVYFEHSKTSYRLLMFQFFFFKTVASCYGNNNADILSTYNRHYGSVDPRFRMVQKLQKACVQIHKVNSLEEVMRFVQLRLPGQSGNYVGDDMALLIKQCVCESRRRGYHRRGPTLTDTVAMKHRIRLCSSTPPKTMQEQKVVQPKEQKVVQPKEQVAEKTGHKVLDLNENIVGFRLRAEAPAFVPQQQQQQQAQQQQAQQEPQSPSLSFTSTSTSSSSCSLATFAPWAPLFLIEKIEKQRAARLQQQEAKKKEEEEKVEEKPPAPTWASFAAKNVKNDNSTLHSIATLMKKKKQHKSTTKTNRGGNTRSRSSSMSSNRSVGITFRSL